MERLRPQRRWLQYSLWTLMLLVLFVIVAMGWIGFRLREAREEHAIVAMLRKGGLSVSYAYQWHDGSDKASVPGPRRLRWVLGDDWYVAGSPVAGAFDGGTQYQVEPCVRAVTQLVLRDAITDEDLALLGRLRQLRFLTLEGQNFSGEGFRHLIDLPALSHLTLDGCQIGERGIEYLGSFRHLNDLSLRETTVRDTELRYLAGLGMLEELDLSKTGVTDAALLHVGRMTRLKRLALRDTAVTGEGLAHLHALIDLEKLDLTNAKVTDVGLCCLPVCPRLKCLELSDNRALGDVGAACLAKLPSLESVELDFTAISDVGLSRLSRLSKLSLLGVAETRVTKEGVDAFQRVAPKVKVLSSFRGDLGETEAGRVE